MNSRAREALRRGRRDLHREMSVPAFYIAMTGAQPQLCTVRVNDVPNANGRRDQVEHRRGGFAPGSRRVLTVTSDNFVVAAEGLADSRPLEAMPRNILLACQRAVNRTAERAATASRRGIREQVNFAAQYLTGTDSSGRQRLGITKRASTDNLEAVITGRHRPISLARFIVGNPSPGKAGVQVSVAPGFARMMRRAFVIRLPAGKSDLETKSNLGLAIRLRPGEEIHNKRVMLRLSGNLYLLYGPSVDQVFATVRGDVAPNAEQFLGAEFVRLIGADL